MFGDVGGALPTDQRILYGCIVIVIHMCCGCYQHDGVHSEGLAQNTNVLRHTPFQACKRLVASLACKYVVALQRMRSSSGRDGSQCSHSFVHHALSLPF
jgi:hypothetical protein